MGEMLQPVTTSFNRSLSIEHRSDRLTGDPGAVVLREILERSGIVEWMMPQLRDPRRQEDVVHDLASLIRTSVLLAAQGWRDHDDADALRDDPAFRLAISSSAGQTPLLKERGLPSLNRPGFTGGQNSRRIAHHGTESKEDPEAVFTRVPRTRGAACCGAPRRISKRRGSACRDRQQIGLFARQSSRVGSSGPA